MSLDPIKAILTPVLKKLAKEAAEKVKEIPTLVGNTQGPLGPPPNNPLL